MKKFLLWKPLLVLALSCNNPSERTEVRSADSTSLAASVDSRDNRLLTYWDGFNFNDTALVKTSPIAEQKLVDFIVMLPSVSDSIASIAIRGMLKQAEANEVSLRHYVKQYADYLYDPNSPIRSELYYRFVLEYLVQFPSTSAVDKIRYQTLLKLVSRNEPGTTAADFSYVNTAGERHQLHEGKADYKLLLFYDPACPHCAAVIKDLTNSSDAKAFVERGKLEIIAIFPKSDRKLWKGYQDSIPTDWISGFDDKGHVIGKGLYSMRAYPTIFLLGKDNKVLLKDAPLDVTLRYLLAKVKS